MASERGGTPSALERPANSTTDFPQKGDVTMGDLDEKEVQPILPQFFPLERPSQRPLCYSGKSTCSTVERPSQRPLSF
jgi:hypothetical protein